MSHTASESLPPDTATSARSSGCEHVEVLDGAGHLVAAQPQEVLRAEVGVVAPDVDDRRLLAHGALHCRTPGDHRADLDGVGVLRAGRRRARACRRRSPARTRGSPRGGRGARAPARARPPPARASGCAAAPASALPVGLRGVGDEDRLARAQLLGAAWPAAGAAWCRRRRNVANATPVQMPAGARRAGGAGRAAARSSSRTSIRCGGPRPPWCASAPCAARGGTPRRRRRRRRPRRR